MAAPVTQEDRDTVKRLHADGRSLRSIAKTLGRSPTTIGKIAKDLGVTFDARPTAAAVHAKVQDNRARRAGIVARLYGVAEADLDYLETAGGYNLTEVSAGQAVQFWVERLPAQDRRALVGAISSALQTAVRTEQVDAGTGTEAAKSMLSDLALGLHAVYRDSIGADHEGSPAVD